jgi:hypothetical protein
VARHKHQSPTLNLLITDEQYAQAVASNSGGCLIADAIKSQYPELSKITVDMATIRVSDRAAGERYTYLTPPDAQHVLLAFDQGWKNPVELLTIKRAVTITPITRDKSGRDSVAGVTARRSARIAELQAKEARGETLSNGEKSALTQMLNPRPTRQRPTSLGKTKVAVTSRHGVVVHGKAPIQGLAHPNLLRGRDRHFGAKMADPGQAFREAVDAGIAERAQQQQQQQQQ